MNCPIKTPLVEIFLLCEKSSFSSDGNLLMRKIGFLIKGIPIVMPMRPQTGRSGPSELSRCNPKVSLRVPLYRVQSDPDVIPTRSFSPPQTPWI